MHGSHDRPVRRLRPALIPATAGALGLLWVVGYGLVRAPMLTSYRGRAALAPLYVFPAVVLRPAALAFVLAGLALVAGAARLADPERTPARRFAAWLAAAAVLLPFALFLARNDPGELGRQFLVYRNEEFYADALRIESLAVFLDHYVEVMPQLSLHGQHFPPGNAVLLYAAQQCFGAGTWPAGATVLLFFAAAIVVVWIALREIAGDARARQAALLCLASPSALDFACTSMDAVFLFFAAVAWSLALRAFCGRGTGPTALLCGAALLVASCFSFSALPLGLWVLIYGLWCGRSEPRTTALRLAQIGASYLACALLLELALGFPIWECLLRARESGLHLIERVSGGAPYAHYAAISYGNAVAFVVGAGIALVSAAAATVRAGAARREPLVAATLLALAIQSGSGLYFLETERIWLFALPWLAAVAVIPGAWTAGSLRVLLAAGFAQALVMEGLLFTIW